MRSEEGAEGTHAYLVLVNEEHQYSLWPAGREIPRGWSKTPMEGGKDDCMNYVDKVWTDMRPLSLRKEMENL